MKFVFFGTPEFAAIVLQKLIDGGFVPAAVVCNPDRPVGRKKVIAAPPVKTLAQKHGVPILQPEQLDQSFTFQVSRFKSAFAVVAAYAKIIPKEIIDAFPMGVVGVHPSLLPKYRGATPIQSAILDGEEETGVTIFMLDEKMDHGQILAQRELKRSIIDSQFSILLRALAELGGDLLSETLPKFFAGEIKPQTQDESRATYTKKFAAADAFVAPDDLRAALGGDAKKATAVDRKMRALNPEPGAWTHASALVNIRPRTRGGDERVKLLEAEVEGGRLKLKKIQFAGERPKNI